MSKKSQLAQYGREVVDVFRTLNLPTDDPAFGPLHSFGPPVPAATPGIEYRTILTNGTGKMLGSGNAQLE